MLRILWGTERATARWIVWGWMGRRFGSYGRDCRATSRAASREPKAALLMATTMALQEAKKSHAALARNESLRVMTVDPLLVFCIYPCSASVFCCRREAGQRDLAPGN